MSGKSLKELNVKIGSVVYFTKYGRGSDRVITKIEGNKYYADHSSSSLDAYEPFWYLVEPVYKTWGEMTPEEKGALLLAKHEGKKIEFIPSWGGEWAVIDNPLFDGKNSKYRVKPEPLIATISGYWAGDVGFSNSSFAMTHKITFQEVDGEPDVTSIKMEKSNADTKLVRKNQNEFNS